MKVDDTVIDEDAQPGVAVFLLAAAADTEQRASTVAFLLELLGFELLAQIPVAAPLARVKTYPFDAAGTEPGVMFICFDVFPRLVSAKLGRSYPGLDNGRIEDAIIHYRRLDIGPSGDRTDQTLWCTRNSGEAWRLIDDSAPSQAASWRSLVKARRAAIASDPDVVRSVSRFSRRAKVEIVRTSDGLAVRKTFRHQSLRFLDREVAFLERMAPLRSEVLPILERGENYFVTPFVESRALHITIFGHKVPKLLSLRQVRQVADFLRFVFAHGYDPVDCAPHNLLIGPNGDLKVIDFEYVQQFEQPILPEQAICLAGQHGSFERDCPVLNKWAHQPYRGYWLGYTGVGLRSFLYEDASQQPLGRRFNYCGFIVGKIASWMFGLDEGKSVEIRRERFAHIASVRSARFTRDFEPVSNDQNPDAKR